MFTMVTGHSRRMASAAAAAAVVAFGGLVLDQGHLGGLPEGVIEVGELTPIDVMQMAAITLPEVVVTARRPQAGHRQAVAARPAALPVLAAAGRVVLGSAEASTQDSRTSDTVLLK